MKLCLDIFQFKKCDLLSYSMEIEEPMTKS